MYTQLFREMSILQMGTIRTLYKDFYSLLFQNFQDPRLLCQPFYRFLFFLCHSARKILQHCRMLLSSFFAGLSHILLLELRQCFHRYPNQAHRSVDCHFPFLLLYAGRDLSQENLLPSLQTIYQSQPVFLCLQWWYHLGIAPQFLCCLVCQECIMRC